MADIEADSAKNGTEEHVAPLSTQKPQWYRSTLFNACVIGGVGFLAPGLWNAMNSLGTYLCVLTTLVPPTTIAPPPPPPQVTSD